MSWYRSLSFYSLLNSNLNHYILNNRWSKYVLFVICHFLTANPIHKNFLSYNQCLQRLIGYQEKHFLSPISQENFEEFRNFLLQLNSIHLTNTEFTLLSILLVIRYGKENNFIFDLLFLILFILDQSNSTINQNDLVSLEQVYFKILHQYENEESYRCNQLLHIREQINHLTELFIQENLFYLPYLLIPK